MSQDSLSRKRNESSLKFQIIRENKQKENDSTVDTQHLNYCETDIVEVDFARIKKYATIKNKIIKKTKKRDKASCRR